MKKKEKGGRYCTDSGLCVSADLWAGNRNRPAHSQGRHFSLDRFPKDKGGDDDYNCHSRANTVIVVSSHFFAAATAADCSCEKGATIITNAMAQFRCPRSRGTTRQGLSQEIVE